MRIIPVSIIPVSVGEVIRDNVTLTVEIHATGIRWFSFRLWVGSRIMKLAALVIGCSIEITTKE